MPQRRADIARLHLQLGGEPAGAHAGLPDDHTNGGIAATGRAARRLLADRGYLGYTFAFGFGFAGLMGYISAAPFVVQNVLGLSTTAYTVTFAVNALGLTAASVAGARLLRRFSPERLLRVAQGAVLLLSAVLLATLAAGLPAVAVLPVLFLTVSCFSLVMGNSSALAVGRAPYASARPPRRMPPPSPRPRPPCPRPLRRSAAVRHPAGVKRDRS